MEDMTKKLIITADDFGIAEDANRGIIECYKKGIVTDMSLLAVGESFSGAVKLAKENNIKTIGVHLALTGPFKPLNSPGIVPSLARNDGKFTSDYKKLFLKYFIDKILVEDIYTEFKKQIERIKNEGFVITHIDSHEHIHMMPGILRVVIRLMNEFGIKSARLPYEKLKLSYKIKNLNSWFSNIILSSMCLVGRNMLKDSGIRHNDRFIGHAKAHNLSREYIIQSFDSIGPGVTELGCHPGFHSKETGKYYPYSENREEELRFFCGSELPNDIKEYGIELISW